MHSTVGRWDDMPFGMGCMQISLKD